MEIQKGHLATSEVNLSLSGLPTGGHRFRTEEEMGAILQHPLVVQAREAALEGFDGMFRKVPKGSDLQPKPYFVHLEEVAQILAAHGFDHEVIAAAYLHDHDEDLRNKGWSIARIENEFSPRVANLVYWVTQDDKGLTWEQRNELYAKKIIQAPDEAMALSLADKTSNLNSLIVYLELGYSVDKVLKRGWQQNSAKFHELSSIYAGHVPDEMIRSFEKNLLRFDTLSNALG